MGHQELFRQAKQKAHELGLPLTVATFDPHPQAVLNPPHLRLFDLEDQQEQFKRHGASGVVYFSFSRDFSQSSAESFLTDFLQKFLAPKVLVVGFNFRFGADRRGGEDLLKDWGQKNGTQVCVVAPMMFEDEPISTSRIRKFLHHGNVQAAARLLGRNYSMSGIVVAGHARGRHIGFPTANLHLLDRFWPGNGVYATRSSVKGVRYLSVSHFGPLPTFGDMGIRLETHLFDFQGSLYGEELKVEFVSRIRDVVKFSSQEELVEQIRIDCEKAKALLRGSI